MNRQNGKTDTAAVGVVFAVCGFIVLGLIYGAQHALLVYGPTWRAFLLDMMTWQFFAGMLVMCLLAVLGGLACLWDDMRNGG